MGMIQTATANMQPDSQTCGKSMGDQLHSQAGLGLLSRDEYHQMKNMNRSSNKEKQEPIPEEDKPEHMGAAEVLQIHSSGNENQTGSAE
ncbi:protein TBATA-like [Xenopus laevis]|uniref:Protein TBATA-like n=1 Tax=Xenopus laevis TaxID=8355 RepID=A0A8J1LDB7_XENLA|nr:protein TBATA-like [Xenopus laevis]